MEGCYEGFLFKSHGLRKRRSIDAPVVGGVNIEPRSSEDVSAFQSQVYLFFFNKNHEYQKYY